MIVNGTLAMLLLISSVFVAVAATHYNQKKITTSSSGMLFKGSICNWLKQEKADSQCGYLIAGVVSHSVVH